MCIHLFIIISLWGKFSQRNTLCKNKVFNSACDFLELVLDSNIEIHQIIPVSQEVLRVVYAQRTEYIRENSTSNIVISLWTTR